MSVTLNGFGGQRGSAAFDVVAKKCGVRIVACCTAELVSIKLRLLYCWDCLLEYAQTVAPVVSCHVADDGAEDRPERAESVRHLWFRKLPDGMGMVAEAAGRHDP